MIINSGRINNCHMNKEVYKMFNNEREAYDACLEEPSKVFQLLKLGHYEEVVELIENNKVNINTCDNVGNNVVMKLLRLKEYSLVERLLKKRNLDVNHQNDEGDTLGHILALDSSAMAVSLLANLMNKKKYLPNIRNNKGETILDRSLKNNYACTALKIIEDKRFDDIDVSCFRRLYNTCLKNNDYGKYSKITNLEIIVGNLAKKDLIPSLEEIIMKIKENIELIKKEIMSNRLSLLDRIINSSVLEATM